MALPRVRLQRHPVALDVLYVGNNIVGSAYRIANIGGPGYYLGLDVG